MMRLFTAEYERGLRRRHERHIGGKLPKGHDCDVCILLEALAKEREMNHLRRNLQAFYQAVQDAAPLLQEQEE